VTNLPAPANEVVAYFLTEYATDSQPSLLEEAVYNVLVRTYQPDVAQDSTRRYISQIRTTLVAEFNERFDKDYSIRYKLLDADGTKVAGISDLGKSERLAFQDALNALTHSQFEGLSALVLERAGCTYVRRTPESHDQGIDAFGYFEYYRRRRGKWIGATPQLVFLAQAKHYSECKVGTKDIRDFVGSFDLALHKIYSTIDTRYKDLELLPFGPVALIFITSEEVPSTVKRIASRAGVVVLSSDDLYDILLASPVKKPTSISTQWLVDTWVSKIEEIPVSK